MSADLDIVDYDALHRIWPQPNRYGEHRTWFQFVGRTRQQRNAIKPLRVQGGPRGFIRLSGGGIRCRSTFSGEFAATR